MSEHKMAALTLDKLVGRFKELEAENEELRAIFALTQRVVAAAANLARLGMLEEPDHEEGTRAAEELVDALEELPILLEPTESKAELKWTTEQPTAEGFYWARGLYMSKPTFDLVEVPGSGISGRVVYMAGSEISYPMSDFTHWAGPIEKPGGP